MRNLKKFLALVLAMAMAFSLMLSAGAVSFDDYGDKGSIKPEFAEAVEVLTGLKVMQGDENGFRPNDSITRAEAAAVIYRAVTGDVGDKQTALYKDYNHFDDVSPDDWFAGYVGYCQNAGYIKGTTPTTFSPYEKVTGYQVLAMILRAVGYGKNGEFTGNTWEVNVSALSKQLGVTKDLVSAHMEDTLRKDAPREVVADLVFMTMATVPMVTYTPALAYNDKQSVVSVGREAFNPTLGQHVFGLYYGTQWEVIDDWGRPGYYWYSGGKWSGSYTLSSGLTDSSQGTNYVVPVGHPIYTGGSVVATIEADYEKVYYDTQLECDVAHDLEIKDAANFNLFVNGTNGNATAGGAVDGDYRIQATDVTTKVGGQGRLSEFYYKETSKWFDASINVCVMIDTMLARITAKTDAKLDKNDHVIIPAQLEVTIYDGPQKTNVVGGSNNSSSNRTISKPAGDADNWDEYSVGEFILLNAYTNKNARVSSSQRESAAFETDKVIFDSDMDNSVVKSENLTIDEYIFIVDNGNDGKADNIQGKQTVVSTNTGTHTVDGKPYDDQLCLFLDRAGNVTNTTFTWYFDQYGNLIGIGDAHAVNFGVITSIYAAFGTGDANTDTTGTVKAVANVRFADGTNGQVTIDRFLMSYDGAMVTSITGAAGTPGDGNNWPADNTATNPVTDGDGGCDTVAATALQGGGNTIELRPVYDTVTNFPLSTLAPNPLFTSSNATNVANLYLAPAAATNTAAHFAVDNTAAPTAPKTWDSFGILYNHMFEFVVASDNSVVAVEVAGVNNVAGASNTGIYVGNANGNVTAADGGRLYKNTAWLTLDAKGVPGAAATATANSNVYLNDNTKIMVRVGNWLSSTTINCYNGVKDLPGDIEIPRDTQVDWADTDGDGRADYVYINRANIPSVIDYALFYFNQGHAEWDGATGTGTVEGYKNGKPATVTFNNLTQYNAVVGSTADYLGHLFALQLTNDIVSDVMVKQTADSKGTNTYSTVDLLKTLTDDGATPPVATWNNSTATTAGNPLVNFPTNIGLSTNFGSKFVVGVPTNPNATNPYSITTAAVYYYDIDSTTAGTTDLKYERVSGGYKVIAYDENNAPIPGAEYWIAPNATIVGELEWLNTRVNYVTMVYESNNANAVMEIYITPVPDVTPSGVITVPVAALVQAGPNVSFPINGAALDSALEAGTRDTVLYCPTSRPATHGPAIGLAGTEDPKDLMYFTFTAPAGSGDINLTLTIRNAETNDLVYSEGMANVAGMTKYAYVINFTSDTNKGYDANMPLRSGVTYTFAIVGDNGVTYSSGNFTMGR